jgi:ThiF family protein
MNGVIVRFERKQWSALCALLFARYPNQEWATWVRYGWRCAGETLVLTAVAVDPPRPGELDDRVGHVAIQEPYSLRMALEAERHEFAVGVVHSHPRLCAPIASLVDDDMDRYYAEYLAGFTGGRPYPSLIVSEMDGELAVSGRVWFQDRWLAVQRWVVEGACVPLWFGREPAADLQLNGPRMARIHSSFGRKAAQRIRNACVAVVGGGGTGSPAIEVLARAGVGHLIVVDPDTVEESNLERLHGGFSRHVEADASKVEIAREHIAAIDAAIRFEGFVGRVPQAEVVDALAQADVILGCTDQQHSRLALSEIAFRHLVPLIDCAVSLEGREGRITGQTIQLVHFACDSPCAACRGMISWRRISQELTSKEDRAARRQAAAEALQRGEDPDPYWQNQPQINTVGYLTTAAGALAAGSALGIISQTFEPGYARLQLNALNDPVDLVDWPQERQADCVCGQLLGFGDLAASKGLITAPTHWKPVYRVQGNDKSSRTI